MADADIIELSDLDFGSGGMILVQKKPILAAASNF